MVASFQISKERIMKMIKKGIIAAAFVSVGAFAPGLAMASGWPVVDAALNAQTALNQAKNIAQYIAQLKQLEAQVKAMTGDRGMQALLSGQNRAYLPPNWNQAMALLNNPSGYSALANQAQQILNNQAVLTTADVSRLTPQMQQLLTKTRQLSATQQALGQEAYQQAGVRVNTLQGLVNAIGGAGDAKAVMDLQARIQAEQTMLQNDQAKLETVAQLGQAQAAALEQMQSEIRVQSSGTGDFPALDTSIRR
jgi:type IV secretion system protein VirB5